jgi:hypothetical protein
VAGALPGVARAAAPADADLAYLRLLVGVELLTLDFAARHLAAARALKQIHAHDTAHYRGLASLLAAAGQQAATPADVDFAYPASVRPLELGRRLKALALGAYLGAVEAVQSPRLRLPIGQIAAAEAQHAGVLAQLAGKDPIGRAFAEALPIERVSAALDEYES